MQSVTNQINHPETENPVLERNKAARPHNPISVKTNPPRDSPGPPEAIPSNEYIQSELPFEYDPIAIENLREAIVQYDLMLLANPTLKMRVQEHLEKHKNQLPH